MICACSLFFGFMTLIAVIALLAAAASSDNGAELSSRLRRWFGRTANAAIVFTLGGYLFNGFDNVTLFLVWVSGIAIILWAIAAFIDTLIQKDTGQEQGNEKNRNQNLY